MSGGGRAHELAHAGARRREPLAEEVEEPRRALDVGEEQRHRPARQVGAAGVSVAVHAPSLGARRLGVHCPAVFDTLSDKLQATLGGLGRSGRLDEEAISKAMREIRLALLEADVNLEVARDFTAVGQGARARPGRPEEPDARPAGREDRPRGADRAHGLGRLAARVRPPADGDPPRRPPGLGQDDRGREARACSCGRTASGPALVACDLQRPAAIDQLEQLGKQIQIPVYALDRSDPVAAARLGLEAARKDGLDVVILDTAGRLHVDEELMEELERVAAETKPTNVLLVLDAMTGQEAVNVALAFQERVAFDGVS